MLCSRDVPLPDKSLGYLCHNSLPSVIIPFNMRWQTKCLDFYLLNIDTFFCKRWFDSLLFGKKDMELVAFPLNNYLCPFFHDLTPPQSLISTMLYNNRHASHVCVVGGFHFRLVGRYHVHSLPVLGVRQGVILNIFAISESLLPALVSWRKYKAFYISCGK